MNASYLILKIIVVTHFILTLWGSMSPFYLPPSYTYMNAFMLAFGFWGIVNQQSSQPILMFLVLLLFSFFQDCIFIGIYQPRSHQSVEQPSIPTGVKNEYRFSLGMSIVNLLIKPLSGFLLYRIMKSRDDTSDINIPGISNLPGFSGNGNPYENIDNPGPYHSNVETAGESVVQP